MVGNPSTIELHGLRNRPRGAAAAVASCRTYLFPGPARAIEKSRGPAADLCRVGI